MSKRTMEPTELQQDVLNFCHKSQAENGYFPTLKEICTAFGWSQNGAATYHLNRLVQKGKLEIAEGAKRTRWRFPIGKEEAKRAAIGKVVAAARGERAQGFGSRALLEALDELDALA